MGRRDRRKAAQRKAGKLGLTPDEKRHLDAMNAEAKRRFGLGIGVIFQEVERARALARALDGPWWRPRPGRRAALAEVALWEGREREVAAAVAALEVSR